MTDFFGTDGAGDDYANSGRDCYSDWRSGRRGHPCDWSDGCTGYRLSQLRVLKRLASASDGAGDDYANSTEIATAIGTAADGDTPATGLEAVWPMLYWLVLQAVEMLMASSALTAGDDYATAQRLPQRLAQRQTGTPLLLV